MILVAEGEKEANKLVRRVFQRAREVKIKFKLSKIQLNQSEVQYMGNNTGANGVTPDKAKVWAIVEMPTPNCKKDIQRLISMLNYLSQYIPDMSTVTKPMRTLLKEDVLFMWEHEQEAAFEK